MITRQYINNWTVITVHYSGEQESWALVQPLDTGLHSLRVTQPNAWSLLAERSLCLWNKSDAMNTQRLLGKSGPVSQSSCLIQILIMNHFSLLVPRGKRTESHFHLYQGSLWCTHVNWPRLQWSDVLQIEHCFPEKLSSGAGAACRMRFDTHTDHSAWQAQVQIRV